MGELYKSVTELMKTARENKAFQGNLGNIIDFQQIIDDTSTADVVEVKHGHWAHKLDCNAYGCYECSCCNTLHEYDTDYCPCCGAKMD